MKWSYAIMHLERTVATIRDDGVCTIECPSFLPFNLFLEEDTDISARVNNLNNFYYWCASRMLTLDRQYAKEILNAIGAGQGSTDRDRAEIALSYHCVTLTDVFWTRRSEEQITYREINLYEHSLSDAFVDVSLFGRALTVENAELLKAADCAGDVSTSGAVPKAWIRRDDVLYLLKDGGERDVNAELLASKIVRCFAVEQVLYEPFFYQGYPVSASRIMTSIKHSIVPMEYVEIYAVNHDTSRQELIRAHDEYGFHMMNILDYLIGNTDRHWGNWGFSVDNETNQITKLHPLMDFNKAFSAYDTIEGSRCLTTETHMSQKEAALSGVRAVGLNQKREIHKKWFTDETQWEMFCRRWETLREYENQSVGTVCENEF